MMMTMMTMMTMTTMRMNSYSMKSQNFHLKCHYYCHHYYYCHSIDSNLNYQFDRFHYLFDHSTLIGCQSDVSPNYSATRTRHDDQWMICKIYSAFDVDYHHFDDGGYWMMLNWFLLFLSNRHCSKLCDQLKWRCLMASKVIWVNRTEKTKNKNFHLLNSLHHSMSLYKRAVHLRVMIWSWC